MAEQSFQSITDNSETRTANFFQLVCTNSVSINLIESELNKEKSKLRKLDNDRRELKGKIKEMVEKLNATEILVDISNAAIQVLEKAMADSAQQNIPASMPFFSTALKPGNGFGQFGDLLKPKEGWWKCKSCYVANKSEDIKCGACKTPKPSSTATQQNTPATVPFFTASSKPTGGFGYLFEPKEGTWECTSCYVRNSADKTKCASCDSENGMHSATKPAPSAFGTSGSITFGAFKYVSSNTPKSTFSFGTTKSRSGFVSGSKPESQPPTFTFGQSAVSSKANETTSNISSIFGESFQEFSQKIFGEKANAHDKSIFGSATNFMFGDLAKSPAELKEFACAIPQKYVFSFEGMRPHSPSKVPLLSAASSDADNLRFEPVIPLPPIVEVKTGEEEEKVLFCKRAKLFRFSNSEWKERGIGDIKILFDEKTNRVRLLMRREQVLKVCLNHHLTKDIKFEWRNDKSLSWTATDFAENEPSPELLAVRFRTNENAKDFKKAIDDSLKVSKESVPAPKSESLALKPASTSLFKADDPVKVQSRDFSFGSLSSGFGGSPPQLQTVFGSATTEFNIKDPPVFSFSIKDEASTGSSFNTPSVFGGIGVAPSESENDEIEVVYVPTVPVEKIKLAQELQLPKFFFLYENKPLCPGCIGCEDRIPPYKSSYFLQNKSHPIKEPIENTLTRDTNTTQQVLLGPKKALSFSSSIVEKSD